MSLRLKPYATYKDSGVPWLQRIPTHWDMKAGFAAYREKHQKNIGLAEKRVLSLSYGRIVVKSEDKLHGLVPESFETYQIVNPHDIVIRSTDLQNDWNSLRVGLVRDRGIITSAYICMDVVGPLIPEYGYQQLNALDLMKVFYGMGSGLRQNLDFSDFKRMPILVPPYKEQSAIVRFLDQADRRIGRYIRTKRRLIALLNEQKQAIIHRAVTHGLDPNVRLKPSGIPWPREMPRHWEVTSLRRKWEVIDCKHLTVPFVDEGIPLASVVEVQSFTLDFSRCKKTTPNWHKVLIEGGRKPRLGDLIYCRNTSVGACSLVDTEIDFAMGQDVCLIRSQGQNQRFLNYQLHSPFMKHQLELLLIGSTFRRINISDIKSLTVFVPPRKEQDAISEFLDSELVSCNTAISRADREIDLIREYRTRLIADVVTGKLDVRSVELPHFAEEKDLSPVGGEIADEVPEGAQELEPVEETADASD